MRSLNDAGSTWVVVSSSRDALWATGQGHTLRLPSLEVETVNPIGCGDCLAAGIAWAVDSGRSMHEALKIGVAAAAENAAQQLPSRLDVVRVLELAQQVQCEEVG